ncbi:MAG: hypothetical protein ACYC35_11720 [Pirellulales bacterium]
MARLYAGILGFLAFSAVVARGVLHGKATEFTLFYAWLSLLALAVVGYVAGRLAEWTVEESVKTEVAIELAAVPRSTEKDLG